MANTPDPVLPTIHRNGTSANMLMAGYYPARQTAHSLLAELEKIEFNPRDYYVAGDEAWQNARAEHEEMVRKAAEIERYLWAHVQHIVKHGGKRPQKEG